MKVTDHNWRGRGGGARSPILSCAADRCPTGATLFSHLVYEDYPCTQSPLLHKYEMQRKPLRRRLEIGPHWGDTGAQSRRPPPPDLLQLPAYATRKITARCSGPQSSNSNYGKNLFAAGQSEIDRWARGKESLAGANRTRPLPPPGDTHLSLAREEPCREPGNSKPRRPFFPGRNDQ